MLFSHLVPHLLPLYPPQGCLARWSRARALGFKPQRCALMDPLPTLHTEVMTVPTTQGNGKARAERQETAGQDSCSNHTSGAHPGGQGGGVRPG